MCMGMIIKVLHAHPALLIMIMAKYTPPNSSMNSTLSNFNITTRNTHATRHRWPHTVNPIDSTCSRAAFLFSPRLAPTAIPR